MNSSQIKAKVKRNIKNRADLFSRSPLCHYCNLRLQNDTPGRADYGTVDHVVPLSRGGRDELDNMVLSCRACNGKKGSKTNLS